MFLDQFAARTHPAGEYGSALYASNVHAKVDPRVVHGVFESMVDISDNGDLLEKYLQMPFPRVFMHGEQNQLSYLPTLRGRGVQVAEIQFSGHWPMYSNAVAMWTTLARCTSGTIAVPAGEARALPVLASPVPSTGRPHIEQAVADARKNAPSCRIPRAEPWSGAL